MINIIYSEARTMMYLIQKLVEMAKKHSNIFFISEKQLNNCEISFDLI
jgi:hypothetical protein